MDTAQTDGGASLGLAIKQAAQRGKGQLRRLTRVCCSSAGREEQQPGAQRPTGLY